MRPQSNTMYRAESKKPKLTKVEKLFLHFAKAKRQDDARKKASEKAAV